MKKLLIALLALTVLMGGASLAEEPARVKVDDTLAYWLDADGALLTVELSANATTGYEWQCTQAGDAQITQESNEYVPDEASGDVVGSGGKSIFTFQVGDGAGMDSLTFDYKRSWEEEIETQYVVNVWVVEAGVMTVDSAYKVIPFEWQVGDSIYCPQCGTEGATVTDLGDGGDEENGSFFWVEINCPTCGKVDLMV